MHFLESILFNKKKISLKESLLVIFKSVISRMDSPFQWWKLHSTKYPILAQVAKKILAIQATSTPSERLWSKAGELCNAKRSQLGAKLIDKILFCNHNKYNNLLKTLLPESFQQKYPSIFFVTHLHL